MRGGDELAFGAYTLRVIETPGHTPEHVCILQSSGFPDVRIVPGSMVAWRAAGYPVTTCD